MTVSQAEFEVAKQDYPDLEAVIGPDGVVTAVAVTIRGINGSRSNSSRRAIQTEYRLLADVSSLPFRLPEGWIASPRAGKIEHANIWPAAITCPLTGSRMPRICWGTVPRDWEAVSPVNRTLGRFLELACGVLADVNVLSPAR
jgi:hypothetical protein